MSRPSPVQLLPIGGDDLARVGAFLNAHLNGRISAERWAAFARPTWAVEAPNHGFMLVDGDAVVGAHLAFYSRQPIGETEVDICNLAAWCVLPSHRFQGLRLLKALLGQPGYQFTDLSPSGSVVPLNARLRFRTLDTTQALVANLPWPVRRKGLRIVSDPAAVEPLLQGRDREIFRDHAGAAAAIQLVIVDGTQTCHVIVRRDRRKRLPLFASILHVGNAALFERASGPLFRHLLLHHGIPATLAELRIVGRQPRFSVLLGSTRARMFRSDVIEPHQVGYLYSELTCVAW